MNPLWSVLIPALVGLLAGILGSLVAPWINWGIEKKREKLKYRREIIQRCRAKIEDANFTKQSFRNTLEYKHIRPYLSPREIEGIERDLTIMAGQLHEDSWNPYRQVLIRAVEKLEKHWDLI